MEIGFYIILAALFVLVLCRRRRHVGSGAVAVLMLASFAAYAVFTGVAGPHPDFGPLWHVPLAGDASYVWLFLAGVLLRLNWRSVRRVVHGRGIVWSVAYLIPVAATIPAAALPGLVATPAAFASQLIMPFWILALAFTWPGLSRRLLGRTDISYGVYLYHFPVINVILAHVSGPYGPVHAAFVVLATTMLSLLSWHLIEKRALRLKAIGTRPPTPLPVEVRSQTAPP
jgi:peptidoglycan/LPS O-acetylase OafA/YrhL